MRPIKITSIILNLQYLKGVYDIYLTQYLADKTPAILFTEHDTERQEIIVTRCMAGYNAKPAERCAFVKDYDENAGALAALISAGIFELTGRSLSTAFVEFPEVEIHLTEEQWAEYEARF